MIGHFYTWAKRNYGPWSMEILFFPFIPRPPAVFVQIFNETGEDEIIRGEIAGMAF